MTHHRFFKIDLTAFILLIFNTTNTDAGVTSIDNTICDSVSCRIIRSKKSIQAIKGNGLSTTKEYEKLTRTASYEKTTEVRTKATRQYKQKGYEDKIREIIAEYGLKTAYFIVYIAHTGEIEAMAIGFPNEDENDREKFPDSMIKDIFDKITAGIRFSPWDGIPPYTSFATGIPEN